MSLSSERGGEPTRAMPRETQTPRHSTDSGKRRESETRTVERPRGAAPAPSPAPDQRESSRDDAEAGEPDRAERADSGGAAQRPRFVVGVGASAGGLEALERMFANMPLGTGMAFVVIQHLSPDFHSMMQEILARRTRLPVRLIEKGMRVEPDTIYVLPSGQEMIISGGRLMLTEKDRQSGFSLPIDQFFRSLAHDFGSRSIAVVLSGTGSDGSRGIRDIHEAGGLVIAQRPQTAKFDAMPRAAIETGVVDLVLAPEEIGSVLAKYSGQVPAVPHPRKDAEQGGEQDAVQRLLRLLHATYGIDFSFYKATTIQRRIERRMLLGQISDIREYLARVESDPRELDNLYRDLLIGVTQFFRDPEAFAVLERDVLPELVLSSEKTGELRMWVVGCATGEEAYSLAISVSEVCRRLDRFPNVTIFASDVHQASLDIAAAGVYSKAALADVPEERLQKYFICRGERYQVDPSIRRMLVFARHNVVQDPPFTRLDLISCRNLLIYFQPQIQKKVLLLFHFALRAGGILFLGRSEGVGDLEDEFTPIDRRWKVYRKRRAVRLAPQTGLLSSGTGAIRPTIVPARPSAQSDAELLHLYDLVLAELVPTGVLAAADGSIRHVFGNADAFLHVQTGRPSFNLFDLLENDLRVATMAAVQQAVRERKRVVFSGVSRRRPDGTRVEVRIDVRPLESRFANQTHVLVLFGEATAAQPDSTPTVAHVSVDEASRKRIAELESELQRTRENLQATIEELETSNEELQAANEELAASNEELQATNEELHSVNEELHSVNAEYQRKIAELTELYDDMEHLFEATEVATVFLDGDLKIRRITPKATEVFNIIDRDVGRRFDSFTHNIDDPDLMENIVEALRSGTRVEREVQDRTGRWYFLRILPYRSGGTVQGVVVTLIDTQTLHTAREELQTAERRLQGILAHAPAAVFIRDREGRFVLANEKCRELFGDPRETLLENGADERVASGTLQTLREHEQEVRQTGGPVTFELRSSAEAAQPARTWLVTLFPLNDGGEPSGAVAGIATDITARKAAEERVQESLRQRDVFLAVLSHELRNPLGAVRNALRVLRDPRSDEATRQRMLDLLQRQTAQMAELLDDLLDIARIEQGRVRLKRRRIDLRQIVHDVVEAHQDAFAGRNIELRVELDERPVWVDADPTRMHQVLANLLLNAAKYTPPGNEVVVSVGRDDGQAVMQVRDTGDGIEPELLPRIFEPFVQGGGDRRKGSPGLGLGLALVKTLVELHGGTVEAFSEGPGHGSRFVVRLPSAHTAAPPSAPAASGRPPGLRTDGSDSAAEPSGATEPVGAATVLPGPQGEARGSSAGENGTSLEPSSKEPATSAQGSTAAEVPSVLIVEDNDDARSALALLLNLEGFRVLTAANGLEALQIIDAQRPKAAVIDLGLPGLDGFELARRIRRKEDGDEIHLIALSGYSQPSDRQRSRKAGFDRHLAKPVDPQELARLLRSVCSDGGNDSRTAAEESQDYSERAPTETARHETTGASDAEPAD
ncbi:MAG: response regulator [Planctomycetota bacterium]|nr:MAG: response regulator [Planctomycetota bacterium]